MKKRFLSVILALCLCMSLLPITAGAIEPTHTDHCVCGGSVTTGDHTHDESAPTWTAWTETNSLPSSGSYYLTEDVLLSASHTITSGTTLNLCLNGHTVTYQNTSSYYEIKGTLNLCDCSTVERTYTSENYKLTGGAVMSSSDGLYLNDSNAALTLYSGNIVGCGETGVYVGKGSFTMYGGEIVGCKDRGVYTTTNGFFTMHGGSIHHNSSNQNSAGVYASTSFTMTGGSITNNNSSNSSGYVGGVYFNSSLTLSGSPVIEDNTINGNAGNLYLKKEVTIGTNGLTNGASIGVTAPISYSGPEDANITNSNAADYSSYFFADDPNTYHIENTVEGTSQVVKLAVGAVSTPHEHNWTYAAKDKDNDDKPETIVATCNGGGTCEATNKELTIVAPLHEQVNDGKAPEATFANNATSVGGVDPLPAIMYQQTATSYPYDPIGDPTATPPTGAGRFEASITVEEQIASVVYRIEKLDRANIEAFTVSDITNNSFVITLDEADWGKSDFVCQIASDYTEFTPDANGKATITVPEAYAGSGNLRVYVCQKETDTYKKSNTTDATVSLLPVDSGHAHPVCGAGCSCGGNHSELTDWAKLTVSGDKLLVGDTEISKAYDSTYYGDCYTLPTGSYYLDEGITLSYGLYIPAETEVTLCLNGNNLNTGGKRNQVSGTLNITDCQTTAGKTTGVADNTESLLYVSGGTVNLYRVELSGNEKGDKGGAVYISNAGKFNMYSGSITGNKAADGGGVALLSGEFNMYGGTVSNNEATGQNGGGGVYVTNGTFSMYGGTITGNTASNQWYGNGGGVYVYSGSFKVSGGATVTGNTGSNIMLARNMVMTAENLVQGASFGVSTQASPSEGSPVTLTGNNNADYSAYFFADNASDYEVANDNGVLKLQVKGASAPTTYTVTVTNDGHGTGSASPATAEAGTQIALTAAPAGGYHFKEWQVVSENATIADNKFIMPAADVTVKAIFEVNAPVTPPATYTVTFNANGGSGTMNAETGISGDYTLPACTFTAPAGKQFKAWSVGSEEKAAGAVIDVSADITVTALWEDISYSITGSVTDTSAGTATVKLMQGNTEVKTATVTLTGSDTNYTGMYSFTGVAPGVYNIVVTKDDVTMTVLVTVASSDVTVGIISMPSGSKNSVLDNSQAGDFAATVGGLDKIAANENIQPGQSVEIKLTVKAEEANNADPEQTAIKAQASGKTLKFIDLSLTKQIDSDTPIDIGDSNAQFLTIVIPFDTNKQGIMVYRYHGSQATAMTKDPTNGNEGFTLGNGFITIYAKNFSTYAIGYTVPAVNPPIYVPTVHYCTSKCDICGGCEDAKCTYSACKDKCLLLGINFTDVADGKWYTEAVEYVYHHKMMEGVGNDLFDINGTTTRAMIVTILWRLEDEPVVNYLMQFDDIPTETWYTEAVRWAASEKIVEGWNGKFDPMGEITREQFATILWRYAKYKGYDVSVGEDTNILSYEDAFSVSEYAIPAMQWACGAGLMQGDGVNLTPKADATRAQAAALFQRFCENVAEK